MPTDYAPRTATQRKVVSSKQSFSPRSFGGGALFGALLVLALTYAPALSGSRADAGGDAGEDPTPPPMPALTYEFMDRLPKEQVVTNVTPYEPPPPADEPEGDAARETRPRAGGAAGPTIAQSNAEAARPKNDAIVAVAPETVASPQADTSRRTDVPHQPSNIQPVRDMARLAASEDMEYMLQAASLRSREDAEAMRARLILDGLSAPVLVVRHPDGGARHRVLVGPFDEERPMRRVQETLRAKNIAALAMRRPR